MTMFHSQKITMFQPADTSNSPFPVLVFVATPKSSYWLGPASPQVIAEQVVSSSGPSGHNVEYVLRLAEWVHQELPDVQDEHLFSIEQEIRLRIKERNLSLKFLMGEKEEQPEVQLEVAESESSPLAARRTTFTSHCEKNCLKCVKL